MGGEELPHPPFLKIFSTFLKFHKGTCIIIPYSYMKAMILTRLIKLELTQHLQELQHTVAAYTSAFNHVASVSWDENDFNGVSLHYKTYQTTRQSLPSQLCCSARNKALEAVKSVRALQKEENKHAKYENREPKLFGCPESQQTSIRYDARSMTMWFDKNEMSLLTTTGRLKFQIKVPEYFQQFLSWKKCSADLFFRDGRAFLHVVVEKEAEDAAPIGQLIGVDRGVKKIAVTSDKRFFGGGQVRQVSKKYQRLRSTLQKKGHSAKRHFRKVSRRERLFRRDVNHCISKQIVSTLKSGTTIVLEKLTGINRNIKRKTHRDERRERCSWSFYQLEEFLKYKAAGRGINVDYVDARYTSQKCSRCGHIAKGNRPVQSIFHCESCAYHVNADLNASFNIVNNFQDATGYLGRADIKQPNAPYVVLASKLQG
jgi:IS605 OrfB family transposase